MDPVSILGLLSGSGGLGGLLGGKGDTKVTTNTNLSNQLSISLTNAAAPGNNTTSTGTQTAPPQTNAAAEEQIPMSPTPIYGADAASTPVADLSGGAFNPQFKNALVLAGLAVAGVVAWLAMKGKK